MTKITNATTLNLFVNNLFDKIEGEMTEESGLSGDIMKENENDNEVVGDLTVLINCQSNPSNSPDEMKSLRSSKWANPISELHEFLSQNKIAFLLGAGCSKCAGLPLMKELTKNVFESLENEKTKEILISVMNNYQNSPCCTIEDYLSELVDHISIGSRRQNRDNSSNQIFLNNDKQFFSIEELENALQLIKEQIVSQISNCKTDINFHRHFIRTVHRASNVGKPGKPTSIDYFTLNYDVLLEDALALERIPFTDGFKGGVTGWWEPEIYDGDFMDARIFKIHGSIDWCCLDDDNPRRIRQNIRGSESQNPILIWPAATKYREAQRDPYAQIIEKLRKTLKSNTENQTILFIVGYSFGDEHINYEIDRALLDPDGNLTIIIFTSADYPEGQIKQWYENSKINQRIRIYANRGYYHANEKIISDNDQDLLWWKFEVITRLMRGEI